MDTDDWVPVPDNDDHEPEDIQQHPEMSEDGKARVKDGYGTDDSDDSDSFDQMVARSNALPISEDLFATEEAAPPPATTAPIKILNVAPTAHRDEISFLTKATEAPPPPAPAMKPTFGSSPQWKPSPGRGVSFPDTPGDDDNASLGNTVASSTFGEDRQKVVDQVILDPYGDKGTYTGIILRSTGM